MNEYTIRLSKPHCDACHKPKVDKSDDILTHDVYETEIKDTSSLAERLQQTIQQASQQTTEQQEEDEI